MTRSGPGWLPLAALVLCAVTACKSDKGGGGADKKGAGDVSLEDRCNQLARVCGDSEKHVEKLATECRESAPEEVAKGCAEKVRATYDCYEKELCGKTDKVWALDDLRVLSDRSGKCTAERAAVRACAGN
jgi:hypothetical protein